MDEPKTGKQRKHCHEYLRDLNAYQAGLRAGYSANWCHSNSAQQIKRFSGYIEKLRGRTETKLAVNAETVQKELACIAFSNAQDYIEVDEDGRERPKRLSELTRAEAAAIEEMTLTTDKDGNQVWKFKCTGKRQALVDLGKHIGMFNERLQMTLKHEHEHRVVDLRHVPTAELEKLERAFLETTQKRLAEAEDAEFTEVEDG